MPLKFTFFSVSQELKLRIFSAVFLIPVTLACLWQGGWWTKGFLFFLFCGLCGEWVVLCSQKIRKNFSFRVAAASFVIFTAGLGIVFMAFQWFWMLAERPFYHRWPGFLYVLGIVWATDVGAYVVGRWKKGPRLAPCISPNKTWWGAWGGTVAGVSVGFFLYPSHLFFFETPFFSLGMALFLTLMAQAGDLLESATKRYMGVKDSGSLIPGHGGLWDRLDSLLFVGTALFLYRCF